MYSGCSNWTLKQHSIQFSVVNEFNITTFIKVLVNNLSVSILNENKNDNYCKVYHKIDTGSHAPIFTKSRQLLGQKLEAAQLKKFRNQSDTSLK